MDLPEFKPSPSFIDKVQLPCLIGKVTEARLPELGLLHEETKDGKVPGFEIYLRSRKPQELSAWHRQWLQKLFEQEEIAPVIRSTMQEYKGDPEEEDYADIQKHGILPFLILRTVVIDEVERRILLRLGTNKDVNLEEHGITIHWKRGKWMFGYADVISDYNQNLDLFNVPKEPRSYVTITDPSFLYGRWVFDEEATLALWRARGEDSYGLNGLRCYTEEFSEGLFRAGDPDGGYYEFKLISCQLKGRHLSLVVKYGMQPPETHKLKYDGHRLIREFVLCREGAIQSMKPSID